jgi:hypothetical protein
MAVELSLHEVFTLYSKLVFPEAGGKNLFRAASTLMGGNVDSSLELFDRPRREIRRALNSKYPELQHWFLNCEWVNFNATMISTTGTKARISRLQQYADTWQSEYGLQKVYSLTKNDM